jgi:glycosyltransferase involved in cell wall biosynthesis
MNLRQKLRPIIDALSRAGYEVEAACNADEDAQWMISQGYKVHLLNVPRSIRHPLQSLAAVRQISAIIRDGGYTVVHSHTPAGGLHANFVAKRSGARFLFYSLRGLYYHPGLALPVRAFMAWGHACAMRRADLVFVVAQHLKEEVLRLSAAPEDRIVVVSGSGVELDLYQVPAEERDAVRREVRAQLGIPPQAPVACIVGRVVFDKGLRELVSAVALLRHDVPDLKLLIVGWGPAEEQVRAMAERLGVASQVIFTGRQPPPEVRRFLWASDFFVFPSYREGFPIATLEAMAAGLPVIASDIPGCVEQIKPGYNGLLVPVRSVEPLAYAMATLAHNPDLRRELAVRAQEMLPAFSMEVSGRQHVEAYNWFLSARL